MDLNSEQLDAFPKGTVLLDDDEDAWQKRSEHEWGVATCDDGYFDSVELTRYGPFQIIWTPRD